MRNGFALLASVWLLLALSVTTAAATAAAKKDRAVKLVRLQRVHARFANEACLTESRSAIERTAKSQSLSAAGGLEHLGRWSQRTALLQDDFTQGLAYRSWVVNPSAQLQLFIASDEQLQRLIAVVLPSATGKIVADNLVKWRAVLSREYGQSAGAVGYQGMLADAVADETVVTVLEEYITGYGSGRIDLSIAPAAVLQSLPGVTAEAAVAIVRLREEANVPVDLITVANTLSSDAAVSLMSAIPQINALTTSYASTLLLYCEVIGKGGRLALAETLLQPTSDGVQHAWIRRK